MGVQLGDKASLGPLLSDITGIPESVLQGQKPLSACSIEERLAWAEGRETMYEEDKAYSLLGIFGGAFAIGNGRHGDLPMSTSAHRSNSACRPTDKLFEVEKIAVFTRHVHNARLISGILPW